MTETQAVLLPTDTYQESGGQVVLEAERGQTIPGFTHHWLTSTAQSGYTGTSYLQTSTDIDRLYQTSQITNSPKMVYQINFTA